MITEWSSFLRIIQYWNLGGVPEKPQNGEFQELPYRSIFQMADRVEYSVPCTAKLLYSLAHPKIAIDLSIPDQSLSKGSVPHYKLVLLCL